MELKVYNQEGKESGSVKLNDSVFGLQWNDDLMHQVVVSMQSNLRVPVAHAKDRSEVRGGGRKPWRQKGTGRARHGSRRSPIWIGGGATHGPTKERSFEKKINKKMMKKALFTALSSKVKDGEILILDSLKIDNGKTKNANTILSKLSKIKGFEKLSQKRNNRAGILVEKKDDSLSLAFRNLPGVSVGESRSINTLEALTFKYLIFTKDALKFFEK